MAVKNRQINIRTKGKGNKYASLSIHLAEDEFSFRNEGVNVSTSDELGGDDKIIELLDPDDFVIELVIRRKSAKGNQEDVSIGQLKEAESKKRKVSGGRAAEAVAAAKISQVEGEDDENESGVKGAGVEEDPTSELAWTTRFNELAEYKSQHGHCNVPQKYKPNPTLGRWVLRQRKVYKEQKLPASRVAKLTELGFGFDAEESKWMTRFNQLLEYKREFGDCDVNTREKAYPLLATWVQKQRAHYEKGKVSAEHIAKLNEVGFIWDAREMRWNTNYYELKKFKREYGHCNVPRDYKPNPKLAAWVNHQRAYMRKGTLLEDRIARLQEVGFVFNINKVEGWVPGKESLGGVPQLPPQLPPWPQM